MGAGAQGPSGPPGPAGPPGAQVVSDPDQVANALSIQNKFLNSLSNSILTNTAGGSLSDNIGTQIMNNPSGIVSALGNNPVLVKSVSANLLSNSTALGGTVADGIANSPSNSLQIAAALATGGSSFLTNLSQVLSDPTEPYAKFITGPTGNIADPVSLKQSLLPVTVWCDTAGNCSTPGTSGTLYLNHGALGTPAFRVAGDGGPWITGYSGGQLGTYNDRTNTGTVAVKWDAQGNITVGDISQTTGSLKVGGDGYLNNLYATGKISAYNKFNLKAIADGF